MTGSVSATHGTGKPMRGLPNQSPERLAVDLENGAWQKLYGELLTLSKLDIGYRLVVHDMRMGYLF